jgi:hypothetical protein
VADFAQSVLDRTSLTVEVSWAEAKVADLMVDVRQLAPLQRTAWSTFDSLPADVQTIVLKALARIAENPRGYRSEQIGEYSYTIDGARMGSSGVFTVPEEAVICRLGGDGTGGLYSVQMGGSLELPTTTPDIEWDYDYPLYPEDGS